MTGADLSFLRPLALTICLEEAAACIMGVRNGRGPALILLANCLTNPAMHLFAGMLVPFIGLQGAKLVICAVMEPLIILLEGWIYEHGRIGVSHPYRFSFILNVSSIAGGVIWKLFF